MRNNTFASPRESYLKGGINEIEITETKKRNLLKKWNLCVNFAIIVDISNNSGEIKIEKVFQKWI